MKKLFSDLPTKVQFLVYNFSLYPFALSYDFDQYNLIEWLCLFHRQMESIVL